MFEYLHISVTEADEVEEPVSLEDAKAWAGVDHSDDDALIESMISGARYDVEQLTGRKLVPHAVSLSVRATCAERLPLPYGAPESITVTVGEDEELDEDEYLHRGRNITLRGAGTYEVAYTVGSSNKALNELIKMLVAYRYNNRGDNVDGKIPEDIIQRAAKYRLEWL